MAGIQKVTGRKFQESNVESIYIRKAELSDAGSIVDFNRAMARETENKELIPNVISAGVNSLLKNPAFGFYIVAMDSSRVVASLMITTEWSDWRNGLFWWIQSVFVEPEYRRQGIYQRMYEFVKNLADNEPSVCGFRLYVERENTPAKSTYSALGMAESPYLIFEELKSITIDPPPR